MKNILTVCVGNICRSPIAAAILRECLPDHGVASAGLGAVIGKDVDPIARQVAEAAGVIVDEHAAQQFTREIGEKYDIILVMERTHKREIERIAPELSGKTFLLSHWTDAKDIPDPFRRSEEFHQIVCTQIKDAVAAWTQRLS